EGVERLGARGRDRDLEPLLAQHVRQRVGERLLVLDDEYAGHCAASREAVLFWDAAAAAASAAGSRRVKVDPEPSLLQTVTSPPCATATCLTMARPRPVPPVSRERAASTRKKRSKMRCWALSGMPMPWSLTLISTTSPTERALMTTRVCSGL